MLEEAFGFGVAGLAGEEFAHLVGCSRIFGVGFEGTAEEGFGFVGATEGGLSLTGVNESGGERRVESKSFLKVLKGLRDVGFCDGHGSEGVPGFGRFGVELEALFQVAAGFGVSSGGEMDLADGDEGSGVVLGGQLQIAERCIGVPGGVEGGAEGGVVAGGLGDVAAWEGKGGRYWGGAGGGWLLVGDGSDAVLRVEG